MRSYLVCSLGIAFLLTAGGCGDEARPNPDGGGGKDAGPGTTFLRGTQTAGDDGIVEFTSIYPGWYRGRAVHVHLRVHRDGRTVVTSQLFFPDELNDTVFANAPYEGNPDVPNASDGIFGESDGTTLLEPTASGDGYAATFSIALAVS